ncbi:hypothetical protein H6G97_22010 [Nostoc flagelliforme FACHB-838]|uniref:Uncharacterized protein n=2 Tax=Nostoc flagelliforme TaxID=1306274 RepID=A0ABR8DRM1_9NOSO|nr:hypothetical protein [Nostoc flagelliforme FACHB-838]
MRKFNKQLFLGFTTAFFVLGSSSLLAIGTSRQNLSNSKEDKLLVQTNKDNVNNYLYKNKPKSYNFLKKKLDEAIKDTNFPNNDSKVVKNLITLGTINKINNINVNENNNDRKVLMVSWIDGTKPYNKDLMTNKTYQVKRTTWLTIPAQVKEFCNTCKGIGMKIPGEMMLSLRLEQYLGLLLKREDQKTHFVEILVNAKDIERPCTNSDITTSSCTNFDPKSLDKESFLFKEFHKTHDFQQKDGLYPFTGLGYTYDWGNPKTSVGATEFIIKPGTIVEVSSVKSTEKYCEKNSLLTKLSQK